MKCWRWDLRHDLSAYVHRKLPARAVKRLENHLLDCGECRDKLSRVQGGHRLALQMPRFEPQGDPWPAIEQAIASRQGNTSRQNPDEISHGLPLQALLARPANAIVAVAIAIALVTATFLITRERSRERGDSGLLAAATLDLREFHPVSIADIERSAKPHVVTEGYVSEVRINDEDRTLTFRLVDELGQPGPFVVCEIIDPIRLDPPRVGSRVRVYGVSRFDGQSQHQWYEVHPVLNIEVLHR